MYFRILVCSHLLKCTQIAITYYGYCNLFKLLGKSVTILLNCHIDKERITSLTHEITFQMRLLAPYKGKLFLSSS